MPFKLRLLRKALSIGTLLSSLGVASTLPAEPFKLVAAPPAMIYAPLIERLLNAADFTMELNVYPSERSLQMTLKGEVDGTFFRQAGAVQSINDQVLLIGPLTCSELVAFVRTDSGVKITQLQDLADYRVGTMLGNKIAEQVSAQLQPRRVLIRETGLLMEMLMAKRIDVVIESERIGLMTINDLGLQNQIQRTGPMLSSLPSYLVLRQHLKDWGPRLQKAFAVMNASGQWQQLYADISEAHGLPRSVSQGCINN